MTIPDTVPKTTDDWYAAIFERVIAKGMDKVDLERFYIVWPIAKELARLGDVLPWMLPALLGAAVKHWRVVASQAADAELENHLHAVTKWRDRERSRVLAKPAHDLGDDIPS